MKVYLKSVNDFWSLRLKDLVFILSYDVYFIRFFYWISRIDKQKGDFF